MAESHLIVGLGNPGSEYARTRHNVGFWALDLLHASLKASDWKDKFGGEWARAGDVYLLKPMTYMNRSGEPTQQLAGFFKIPTERVIVIHDELDFDPGVVRMKLGGGAGGHNGLRSLIACIGEGFVRLRLGVGKPRSKEEGASFVLGTPPAAERQLLEDAAKKSADGAMLVVDKGIKLAMNQFNTR